MEEGLFGFACANIASGLLNYRRVMDYDTYATPESVDEFLRVVNVKSSILFFREMLSPSGSEPEDARDMAASFASMQRQEQRKGGPISRRSSGYAQIDTLPAQRYCPIIEGRSSEPDYKSNKTKPNPSQIMACDK